MNFIKRIYRIIKYGYRCDSDTFLKYIRKKGVKVGNNCNIVDSTNFRIDLTRPFLISIGNDVTFSDNVTILTHDWSFSVVARKYPGDIYPILGEIKIGDNVFVGSHSTILKGVTIGKNVIIGSCSLVNHDIPDDSVYAGVPAKPVCSIEEFRNKIKGNSFNGLNILHDKYMERYCCELPESQLFEHLFLF